MRSGLRRGTSVQVGCIFKAIRELLDEHFVVSNIVNIPRQCNKAAHELAHCAISWNAWEEGVSKLI